MILTCMGDYRRCSQWRSIALEAVDEVLTIDAMVPHRQGKAKGTAKAKAKAKAKPQDEKEGPTEEERSWRCAPYIL